MDMGMLFAAVERQRARILDAEAWIWRHPETGFREKNTSAYMERAFRALGYEPRMAGDIPGFTAELDTGRPGPCVLVLAELDSLICADHPDADPITRAVHACGHHAQCAALLGLAAALREPGVADGLSGRVRLCVVPAEELIETGYRESLRAMGVIRYYGGKVEFLRRGLLDGADMAFMLHTAGGEKTFSCDRGSNGCVVKNIRYKGVAAHAGGSPHMGVNALYAASLGMQAVNALRETFRDEDHIRFHPIVTSGGDAVNAIPSLATMESYVRGASLDAIRQANGRVNRALAGAALSLGANVEICDRPGYTPLINDPGLLRVARRAMVACAGEDRVEITDQWDTGCTDMGDLSAVMPAIHPYVGGATGTGHGRDYRVSDPETACVMSAKCQLTLLSLLLENGASEAKAVLAGFTPRYASYEAYMKEMDGLQLCQQRRRGTPARQTNHRQGFPRIPA